MPISKGVLLSITGLVTWMSWLERLEASGSADYTVRLCVSSGSHKVEIRGKEMKILDGDVRDVLVRDLSGSVTLRTSREGLCFMGLEHKPRSVILSSAHPFAIGRRMLAGKVEIIRDHQGKLLVVNHLPLERYLMGILVAEMSPSWPLQALMAQAVASRTYTVHRTLSRQAEAYDLSSTTLDQVYAGIAGESARVGKAVSSTKGLILVYGNLPAEALFHSCCAGNTRSAKEVFGNRVAYLVKVDDKDCAGCPREAWRAEISIKELEKRLNQTRPEPVEIMTVRHAGESTELIFRNHTRILLSNHKLRLLMGERILWSPRFNWKKNGSSLRFRGRGSGHGVGMCQWGARRMAERGATYKEILLKYYPGCKLRAMY